MATLYIFRLNPKRSWAQRRASFVHLGVLLFASLLFAVFTTVIWCQFHESELHLPKEAEGMLGVAILALAAIFAIPGGLILTSAWDHIRNASKCVLQKNRTEFILIRDERAPISMHLVLVLPGLFLLLLLGAAHYPSFSAGVAVMFPTSFALAFFFLVLGDVQDAINRPWFREQVPNDWWE